jgi:hypothetical protein
MTKPISLRLIKGKKFNIITLILTASLLCYIMPLLKLSTDFQAPRYVKHAERRDQGSYLAYLPHSGLSNQRIELANALLLAHMLNRTLIVPPAFLGTVFGWMGRDQLTERLDWLTTPKNFPKLCQRPTPDKLSSYIQRSRCAEYRNFGAVSWQELHDFSPLANDISLKFQSVISMSQLKQDLQLNDTDIYVHEDVQLYDWRLYQNQSEAIDLLKNQLNYFDSFAGRRYYKVLLPHHFQRRTEKLLYLGGIFGSTRFNMIEPKDVEMQAKIKNVLRYRLDTPLGTTVKSIVNYLGGKGSFMSVHFRTGDRPFKNEVSANLISFVQNMTELVSNERYQQQSTQHCLNVAPQRSQDTQDQQLIDIKDEYRFSSDLSRRVKVYVATDHRDPRGEESALLPWFQQFPCTTILSDIPDHLFSPLDNLRDIIVPSKSLRTFLIPLVDAMVAAHGKQILTTPRSTFSRYIEELHGAWV